MEETPRKHLEEALNQLRKAKSIRSIYAINLVQDVKIDVAIGLIEGVIEGLYE